MRYLTCTKVTDLRDQAELKDFCDQTLEVIHCQILLILKGTIQIMKIESEDHWDQLGGLH